MTRGTEFPRQTMPKINGKSFHCDNKPFRYLIGFGMRRSEICGANVFTEHSPGRFECNGCGARWIGEPA